MLVDKMMLGNTTNSTSYVAIFFCICMTFSKNIQQPLFDFKNMHVYLHVLLHYLFLEACLQYSLAFLSTNCY